jgi:hypothetical protein
MKCRICKKKLFVPSWTVCDDCDYTSFRNAKLRKEIRLAKAQLRQMAQVRARKIYQQRVFRAIPPKYVENAQIIVIDDNGMIVGWKD